MSHAPKPYQLEFKTDRDNLNRWWSIVTNYCRQKPDQLPFFKGGDHAKWTPECKDPTRGKADAKLQVALHNILNTIASFCPNGTFGTITTEADSLEWIYGRVAKMCHIQIGGRHLVNAWDLKFDQGNESPDIFYMRLKSAFSENLLAKDGKFHGQAQATSEVFSPMAESMIVIKWLEAINPALPRHIQDTRATLFTSEKPNFADIQQDLCEIMDTLLQEIEQVDSVSALSVQDDYDLTVEANRISFQRGRGRGRGGFANRNRNATRPWSQQTPSSSYRQTPAVDKLCKHCKTVGKDSSIYTSHDVDMCFDLYPEKRRGAGVRMLSIPVHVDENDQFDPEEAQAFFQAYKLNQGLSCSSESSSTNNQ